MIQTLSVFVLVFASSGTVLAQHISCPTISCPSISCPTISCPANSGIGSSAISTPAITIPPITIPSTNPACASIYCPAITCSPVSCSGAGGGIYNPAISSQIYPAQTYPTNNVNNNQFGSGYPNFGSGGIQSGPEFNFSGHYQSTANESSQFDDFLNALGLNFLNRPKLIGASQEIFITKDKVVPNSYQVKNSLTAVGDTYYTFVSGQDFNENRLYDGKNVRTVINVLRDRWVQNQYGQPEVQILWEFGVPHQKALRITTSTNRVSSVRNFVKKI